MGFKTSGLHLDYTMGSITDLDSEKGPSCEDSAFDAELFLIVAE